MCCVVYMCVALSESSGPEAGQVPDPPPGSGSVEGADCGGVEPREPATPLGEEVEEEEEEEEMEEMEEEDTSSNTSDICLGEVLRENQSICTPSTIWHHRHPVLLPV